MKLALAPIPYYWQKEVVYDFYKSIETAPVDIVYLGEVVCAKRHELRFEDWVEIGKRLQKAGKEVVFSTQVLLESDTHLNTMRRVVQNGYFSVEANDMGALRLLANKGNFVAGLHLNIYNPSALSLVSDFGAKRWVMPLEMNKADLEEMIRVKPDDIEVEVFAYGRMPLAFSARCFTARYYNFPKDDCHFNCIHHPEGLLLKTRESEDFLILNGIQTQSDRIYCLLHEIPLLQKMGINVLRITPQQNRTTDVLSLYQAVLTKELTTDVAFSTLKQLMPAKPCNGYWYARPGMEYLQQGVL